MPPSLLVNDVGELVHAFGGASRFLKVKAGRQGSDVFEMLDCDLKMLLTGGLQRAIREPAAIVFKGVQTEGGVHKVTMRRVESRRGTCRTS